MDEQDLLVRIGLTEKQYLAALGRLERRSMKSAKTAEASWKRQNQHFVRGSRDMQKTAGGLNGSLRGISQQLSQVAQQGAVTGDYLTALSIQAADLGLAFGIVGTAIGAAISALGPMALAIVRGSDEADEAEKSLDRFASAVARAADAARTARTPISELREEFGDLADGLQETAVIAVEAGISDALREVENVAGMALEGLRPVLDALAEAQKLRESLRQTEGQRDAGVLGIGPEQVLIAQEAFEIVRNQADDLAADLGLTTNQAVLLADALGRINGEDLDQAGAAALDVLREIENIRVEGEQIPPVISEMVQILRDFIAAAGEGAQAIDAVGDAAAAAAAKTASLARALQIARISQSPSTTAMISDEDLLMGQSVVPSGEDREAARRALQNLQRITAPSPTRARSSRTRRSGSSGATEAERARANALREVERHVTSTRTAIEAYQASLKELEALKPFFEETGQVEAYHRAVAELNSEFEKTQHADLLEGIESISDAMAGAIVDGQNMGDALRQVFKQAAADLLSSGLQQGLASLFGAPTASAGGGLFGRLFAGFFDAGGAIPSGQFGIVGERGPEIVRGPASVTSRADTARMMGGTSTLRIELAPGLEASFLEQSAGQTLQIVQANNRAQSRGLSGAVSQNQARGT